MTATVVHEDYCGYPDDCNCCKVAVNINPVAELLNAFAVIGLKPDLGDLIAPATDA